ncbi:hypothetical protein JVU11DRAFT_4721 [Chiua virens]|nr:hypothetical protein JVU11DRAFT_4721 [Chiua virens]
MLPFTVIPLLFAVLVAAHGDHDAAENTKLAGVDYAIRHMASEHHIDSFDLESFFQLHDLNRDGVWDREEIEAIYGVHHVYSQKKSKDEIEHQKKADHVVDTILKVLDKSGDGKVTPEEFEAAGFDGLPSFDEIGAEGHHYDVESEFFLHHEEQFHSTPETQTDESYTHPEDIEHFSHHEGIELLEAEREAKFQGITIQEAMRVHDEAASKAEAAQRPKITRGTPKQDPAVKYKDIAKEMENQSEWGAGEQGYKQPKSPGEKMRKNLPYKVRHYVRVARDVDGPLTSRNACSTNSSAVGATFSDDDTHPSIFCGLLCCYFEIAPHFYTLYPAVCLDLSANYEAE